MLRNHLLAAVRNFKKHRFHTIINILGLGLGIMASLLAFVFVLDELSFDKFHSNYNRLYRLNKISFEPNGTSFLNAESSGMMGPTMVSEFGEVEKVVRYQPWYNTAILSNNDRMLELAEMENVFVDSTFFEVFDFELVRGNPKTVLTRPSTIVLTEKISQTLFGNEDPIGKSIIGLNGLPFEVTGIAKEAPRNSHIQYKALISWSTTVPQVGPLAFDWMNNWIAQALTTYVVVKPNSNVDALQGKFKKFMQDHIPTRVTNYQLYLQPFGNVYLDAHKIKYHRMAKTGNREYVYIFSIIAGFILFIACINYINISTSKSIRRAREVGTRKSLGATQRQLIVQFLAESLMITTLAALLAIALLYLAIPYFNQLAGKTLPFELLLTAKVIVTLVALTLLVAVISGLYPAFVLSSFRPSEVLKASTKSKIAGNLPRHILITFQFIISVVILACTLLVARQMDFVMSKDLGMDKEHVLVVNLTNEILTKGRTFADEVATHRSVQSVSLGRMALGQGGSSTFVQPEGFPPDQVEIRMFPCDGNFQKTYGLEMAMGRFFDLPRIASDSNALVINEALAKQLNWTNPIQKTIKFQGDPVAYPIIGVLKDFNFSSLYEEVEPLVMWINPANQRNLSVRFSGNPSNLLSFLETKWKSFESRYPFKYYFLDQAFARAYEGDQKLFKTMMTFAGLSILIACLGLYGLVSFTIEQRIKEFGIRKVFGATTTSLNLLVNRKFMLMVVIASGVAIPIVLKLMSSWLEKFAFKIDVGPGIFILATAITLAITLAAVSIQTIRAAMLNPAESLRHE
jgi:putative ABC transport system permease protein